MPFQGNNFSRNQNFVRDRDLGPPESTISAAKVDGEFDNMADALTVVKTAAATADSKAVAAAAALTGLNISAFVKTVLDDGDAAAVRGTIGAASVASPTFTGTMTTGVFYGTSNVIGKVEPYGAPLIVAGAGGNNGAFLAFHCPGTFGAYVGLDAIDHQLKIGGWSYGTASYKIWHGGNDGAGSGLDADLLDGLQSSASEIGNTVVVRTADGSGLFGNRVSLRGGAPGLNLYDTDYSVNPAYLYTNQGSLEFQGTDGFTKFLVSSSGTIYTAQFGDLGTWIENRASAWASTKDGAINAARNQSVRDLRRVSISSMGPNAVTPSGTFAVGALGINQVEGVYYAYLQGYSFDRGWFNVGDG